MKYTRKSVYPDDIDPLIFFQDADIERAPELHAYYQYIINNRFQEARDYINASHLDFYGAWLLNMIEDRLRTTEENIGEYVEEKMQIVVNSDTEPRDQMTEDCFNWTGDDVRHSPLGDGVKVISLGNRQRIDETTDFESLYENSQYYTDNQVTWSAYFDTGEEDDRPQVLMANPLTHVVPGYTETNHTSHSGYYQMRMVSFGTNGGLARLYSNGRLSYEIYLALATQKWGGSSSTQSTIYHESYLVVKCPDNISDYLRDVTNLMNYDSETGEGTLDIRSIYQNYRSLSKKNFLVVSRASTTGYTHAYWGSGDVAHCGGNYTLNKTYRNGILTFNHSTNAVVDNTTVSAYGSVPQILLYIPYNSPVPTTLTVTPSTYTFSALNQTYQLSAQVYDSSHQAISDKDYFWSSSDESVVTVSDTGQIRSIANGTARITCECCGLTAYCDVTVSIPVATSISISPSSVTFTTIGTTQQFTATVYDQNHNPMSGQTITWSSNDTSVATVNNSGLVYSIGDGTTLIHATCGSLDATASITVTGPVPTTVRIRPDGVTFSVGDTERITAKVYDQYGNPMDSSGYTFTWTVEDPSKVSLTDLGGGLADVTGLSVGGSIVFAYAADMYGTVGVIVSNS